MNDCSPVTRQESHFASLNCHPLCINRNQTKYPFLQLSYFLSYSLVKCLHRQLFIHLFSSKLGKYVSVSWNKLKIITLNVVSCYGSVLLFIAFFFFPENVSCFWFVNDVRFPWTLFSVSLLNWGRLERKMPVHIQYANQPHIPQSF